MRLKYKSQVRTGLLSLGTRLASVFWVASEDIALAEALTFAGQPSERVFFQDPVCQLK